MGFVASMRRWVWGRVCRVLPRGWVFGDDVLTVTARSALRRVRIALVGGCIFVSGVALLSSTTWKDVLAGSLLAWGVAMIAWASTSHRNRSEEIHESLRHNAELDVLHARLNQIAERVGAPLLILDYEFEHAVGFRYQRQAHMSGLEEFHDRAHTDEDGARFWDNISTGYGPTGQR